MTSLKLLCVTIAVFATVGCHHGKLRWQTPSVGFSFDEWQLNVKLGLPLPIWEPKPEGVISYESPFQVPSIQETEATGYTHQLPEWKTTEGYESEYEVVNNPADWSVDSDKEDK